jgi:chromosome segregation ATPase
MASSLFCIFSSNLKDKTMLRNLLLSTIIIVFTIPTMAQKLEVTETNSKFDKTSRPALMVEIPYTDQSTVEKEWKKLMKDYNPEKFKSRKEMFADNATIDRLSENTVDVYAKVDEKKDIVTLFVAVDLGGAFLSSSDGDKIQVMKGIVRDFAIKLVKEIYDEKIKEQEKNVEDIEKEVEGAKDNKAHLEKEIESYKQKIEDNELEIEKLSKTIETQGEKLKDEQKVLDEIKKEAAKIK